MESWLNYYICDGHSYLKKEIIEEEIQICTVYNLYESCEWEATHATN